MDANTNLLLAIILGLLALLYLALFLIVRRRQRIMEKQDFERKRAELALLRQKDLYNVLSQSNKAIVRIVGRDELFATVCRVAVEHGRFRFAWVGLIDNDDQRLKPIARYGEDAGYIDQLDVSGDGASALRRGLTGRMLLSGAYMVSKPCAWPCAFRQRTWGSTMNDEWRDRMLEEGLLRVHTRIP